MRAPPLVKAAAKELSRLRTTKDCGQFCLTWPIGEHCRFWVSLLGGTDGESPIVGLVLPRIGREMCVALKAVGVPQPDSERTDLDCLPIAMLPWHVVDSGCDPRLFERLLADGAATEDGVALAVDEILRCEAKIASVAPDEAATVDWVASVLPFAPTSSFALPVAYHLLGRGDDIERYETKYVAYLRGKKVNDDSISLYRRYVQHVRESSLPS